MQADPGLGGGKEEVKFTGQLPPGVVPPSPKDPGVIKESEAPAWYENLFQAESSRELSSKEIEEEEYSLPSVPTWSKFESSKVGKAIDAKGLVKEKDDLMRGLGYKKGEEKDLAMDVAAVFSPGADIAHATTKAAEGKYLDAGLYALFAVAPGTAAPLVKKAKELLGLGKKQAAKELLENTIKKNENVIAKQMDVGGVNPNKAPTGVNPNTGYKYDMDVLDVENPIPSFTKADLDNVEIPRMKKLGQALDASNFDVSTLTKDNITFKGRSGGRTIVEIDLGNGQKQLFYKSTGSAKKSGGGVGGTTEGLWQPYAGHSNSAGSKGWFGKDAGYEDWYKSKSFNGISGNLDKLATEKGINLNLQMNDSVDKTFEAYRKRVGADQADIANIQ